MVMPRSRSISMESSTCSFISRWVRAPVSWMSRSDRVDFPWSMWATMEKVRMRESGVVMRRPLSHPCECARGVIASAADALGADADLLQDVFAKGGPLAEARVPVGERGQPRRLEFRRDAEPAVDGDAEGEVGDAQLSAHDEGAAGQPCLEDLEHVHD